MNKKTVLIVSLIHLVILLCMFLFYCKLPQDPAQNPQNVEITFLTESDDDTVTIGDSVTFKLSVLYPYLVDSVVIKSGDSVVLTLRSLSDTLSVSLSTIFPGKYPLTITGYCQQNVTTTTQGSVFVKSVPISIAIQPGNNTAVNTTSALFIVKASGNPVPSIQWFRDSTLLAGQTRDTLRIDTVTTSMNGSRYRALLFNSADSLWSSSATLTVLDNVSRWDAVRYDNSVWW